MYFLITFEQILIMFVLMGIGYAFAKSRAFSKETIKELSRFVMYTVGSCVIINAYNREATLDLVKTFLMTALAGIILFVITIFLASVIFKLSRYKNLEVINDFKFGATFSNCAFMGIPLIEALLGPEGIFFSIPYLALFNIFLWSYGVRLFEDSDDEKIDWQKVMANPVILSAIIGFILFVTGILNKMPAVLTKPISYIASMNTPLSMMIVGSNFINITEPIYKDKKSWELSFFRNLFFPLIYVLILFLLPINNDAKIALLAMSSAPIAGTSVLFSVMFNKSTDFPSRVLCLSTLLSIITLPLIVLIGQSIF